MPRRTTDHYLHTYHWLRSIWLTTNQVFGYLTYADQRTLHDYFCFAIELSEADLLAHRSAVTAEKPSLPQRAGRVLAKLDPDDARFAVGTTRSAAVHTSKSGRRIVVRGIAKPQVDYKRLSKALIAHITTQAAAAESACPADVRGHLESVHRQP
jgi:sigma54-dependent transcription regulator